MYLCVCGFSALRYQLSILHWETNPTNVDIKEIQTIENDSDMPQTDFSCEKTLWDV